MAGIAEAERRIKGSSNGGELLLSGLGLTSLTPLLSALKGSRDIQALDLSANHLVELPADLSEVLPHVTRLNLSANPIPGVRTVLMGLRSLPALSDLWIDLPLETEEDQLIVALPNLERFNGTSLVDDDPAAMVDRSSQHASEPSREKDATNVSGNGTDSGRATYWTSDDSRSVEELFAQVSEASTGATHPQEFFDYLSRVVKHVTCLTAADDDPLCQEGEVLKARRLLFEYCAEEMAKAVSRKDAALGRGVTALVQYNSLLMDAYDTHWRRIFRDRDARLTLMKRDMKDAIKQIESLMTQVNSGAGPLAQAIEFSTGAEEEEDAAPPRGGPAPRGAGGRSRGRGDSPARERVASRSNRRGARHTDPAAGVREFRPYFSSDGEEEGGSGGRQRGQTPIDTYRAPSSGNRHTPRRIHTLDDSRNSPAELGKEGRRSGSREYGAVNHNSIADPNATPYAVDTPARLRGNISDSRARDSHARDGGAEASYNGKVLTLKQLKDTIEEIYSSKTKYDAKCKENGLPRETMEQHMYTYLNQRYGLKEIIQDWATAIARGIKRYAADDNDVAVFGKILRNDVDEEFRYVQRQVRDTVRELLRAQLKARRPLRSNQEINNQLEKKMASALTEEEWGDVVRYMYNSQDAATLTALIRKIIYQQTLPSRMRRHQSRGAAPAAPEAALISYKDFVHLLLDFQLEGHVRFLANYTQIFRRYDKDGNGIVNSEEFKAIVRAVDSGKGEDEVEAMANLIDPFGSQLITFSETVAFLSDELVNMAKG